MNQQSIIGERVQQYKSSMEEAFRKMGGALSGTDQYDLPPLKLQYLVDDYSEFKESWSDSVQS